MSTPTERAVLVVDVGGTSVKFLATGQTDHREAPSGAEMDAEIMVRTVKGLAGDWHYDMVTLGYPGRVHKGRPVAEPKNLKSGWVVFDFEAAFGCPVRIINDAAMQALGSYDVGRMLFLGLGTGVGSTLIVDGHIVPLSLGEMAFKRATFDYYLNRDAFKRLGPTRWQRNVIKAGLLLKDAFEADYVVLGGGKADRLEKLPEGLRRGDNRNAFLGGFRLWERD